MIDPNFDPYRVLQELHQQNQQLCEVIAHILIIQEDLETRIEQLEQEVNE